jgi:hypothetical protein
MLTFLSLSLSLLAAVATTGASVAAATEETDKSESRRFLALSFFISVVREAESGFASYANKPGGLAGWLAGGRGFRHAAAGAQFNTCVYWCFDAPFTFFALATVEIRIVIFRTQIASTVSRVFTQ